MSTSKTNEELTLHKEKALNALSHYIDSLIASNNPSVNSKADKLCYWLEDYTRFLTTESTFSPSAFKRYKRGDVIKVHLGYNIGSEEGGLHYAVVLDAANSIYSPVLTIAPLTSVKRGKDLSRLRNGEIFIGNQIYTSLHQKIEEQANKLASEITELDAAITELEHTNSHSVSSELKSKLNTAKADYKLLDRMKTEITKMKIGSIVLTNQITTVSKIRIYDPKNNHDVLSGIRLDNTSLDLIDQAICTKYMKPQK